MENALLIGLSRQTALQRELDVVANNIANVNTTGFKADGAVFAEFLQNRANAEPFAAPDRRMSFVQDRMSWHDMSQGTIQQTGGPLDVAIDGEGMLVVQTARGERYTRNGALQLNNIGELVTIAGDKVMGENGPIVLQATDRDITITKDGTIKVREGISLNSDSTRGKLRLVTFANPQQLRKDGASTFAAPDGVAADAAAGRQRARRAGLDREIERAPGDRDDAHDRAHARLHRGRHHPAAAGRPAEEFDPAAR